MQSTLRLGLAGQASPRRKGAAAPEIPSTGKGLNTILIKSSEAMVARARYYELLV
jgi:hypothetical protein